MTGTEVINLLSWVVPALLAMYGMYALSMRAVFGRRYKQRIAALEARPSIVQNFQGDDAGMVRELWDKLKARDMELADFKTVANRLRHEPIPGTNATYAELPTGARIVTMADGSMRLALPVRISGGEGIGVFETYTAKLTRTTKGDPPE